MMHEDPETVLRLQLLHDNIVAIGSFMDESRRSIKIHNVFGGPSEYFFLMEWEDTRIFFTISSYEGIELVEHGYYK